MESHFDSDFFAGNRRRLRELFTGTAPIVVTANGALQRGGDITFAFAQDASFWYLTGIDEQDVVLVMDSDKEYLILPERSDVQEIFEGVIKEEVLAKRSGIKKIYNYKDGWQELGNRLDKVKHVATLAALPAYLDRFGFYSNPARAALVQKLSATNEKLELLDIGPHIARLRMVKQQPELKAIQAAIDMTIGAIKETLRPTKLTKYNYEYEIEAELSRGFRRRGALGNAFYPIVAGGARACTVHNVINDSVLGAGELVVIDVGAEVEHYAADITRTIAYGKPTRRQQAIHQTVLEVQQFAFDLLKPGVLMKNYEQQVEDFMGEKLRSLGLIKTIDHENVRRFYPHASSHFLGLNAHDAGDYDRPLEPGVVLTVEPGIYIPAEGIGVRIEDDVLITAGGIKILSDKLPRTLV
jgi:Xaa-Pro aminopeptidase